MVQHTNGRKAKGSGIDANGQRRLRAALYYRMSRDEQAGSIERQRSQVEPYAEKKYEIVGSYKDEGIPGDEFAKRTDFQRLLRDAADGKFDVVVADESSRISRQNVVEFIATVVHPLQMASVGIDTVAEGPMEWDDLVQIIMLAIRQNKSVEECRNLSRRVLTGLAKMAKTGKWMGGRAPYGYKYDREKRKLVIVPERAVIIRDIFAYYLSGTSIRSIAHSLTARGIRPPESKSGAWMPRAIHAILKNAAYYGAFVWNRSTIGKYHRLLNGCAVPSKTKNRIWNDEASRIIVENAHEPIIDKNTFNAAALLLAQKRSEKHKRAPSKSPNAAAFTLSGLLTCGLCKHAMCGKVRWPRRRFKCPNCRKSRVATLRPGKIAEKCKCGHTFPIPEGWEGESMFVCTGGHLQGSSVCRSRMVEENDVLHCIGDDIETAIGEPEEWREEVTKALRHAAKIDPIRLAERRAALAGMDAKIKEAAERFLFVPPSHLAEVTAALDAMKAEKARIESEIGELEQAVDLAADLDAVADQVVSHMRILRLHLVSGEREKVRSVVQRFVERVTVVFDRDAASASVVKEFRIKYRDEAFTIRNLIPACANLVQHG